MNTEWSTADCKWKINCGHPDRSQFVIRLRTAMRNIMPILLDAAAASIEVIAFLSSSALIRLPVATAMDGHNKHQDPQKLDRTIFVNSWVLWLSHVAANGSRRLPRGGPPPRTQRQICCRSQPPPIESKHGLGS